MAHLARFLILAWVCLSLPMTGDAGPAEGSSLPVLPASLGQWYRPLNKRQVWLHRMFTLRRELQAITEYLAAGDRPRAQAWANRFARHYRRIPEMVPEWRDELDLEALGQLQEALKGGPDSAAERALRALRHGCTACHRDYQALAAARYRVPDYAHRRVVFAQETFSYPQFMDRLSVQLNRIKIAAVDGRTAAAQTALGGLRALLHALGEDCSGCHHKDPAPRNRILGTATPALLDRLAEALKTGDQRSDRLLGEIAVRVCARCHGIHRTLADLRARVFREEETRKRSHPD